MFMDKVMLIWIGVLFTALFVSLGEAFPYKGVLPRILWIVAGGVLYAYLLHWNYQSEKPIPLLSLVIVWTVVNAMSTFSLFVYFNWNKFSQLGPKAFVISGFALLCSIGAVALSNWVMSLLEA